MSISKYETLAKVVELGSLTRAADALGCTQSAVSHTINNLEAELGFSVITRSRAGVKLTADGERIMPSVRGMLNYEEQLRQPRLLRSLFRPKSSFCLCMPPEPDRLIPSQEQA